MSDINKKATDPQKIIKAFAVKNASVDAAQNKLCGFPSVTGILDCYGDVIFPGAFQKALPLFLKRGFTTQDHVWHWQALVGFPTVAEERGNKLYSEFTFHSDQQSQDARAKCQERLAAGMEVGLSIGFTMMPGQYIYFGSGKELLTYAKTKGYDLSLFDVKTISAYTGQCTAIVEIEELWEYSLTPCPANPEAMAVAVKSYSLAHRNRRITLSAANSTPNRPNPRRNKSMKKICGAPALTLTDDDHAWSAQEAEARVRTFAGAETEPNAEYAKAFVAVDGPNDTWASYKLLFADVVDGQLQAVPKALLTAAAVLDGQRGGSGLSGTDLASAKTFVEAYHRAMGKNTPWGSDSEGECRWKGQYLGEYIEYSMCMAAMQQAWYALYYECADALTGYGDYGDMDDAQLGAALSDMFDEHKNLCLSVFQAIRSGGAEETAEQAAKSVRRLSLTHLSSLGDGLTYTKHTRMAVDAARGLVERTKGRLDMRLKEGRALSEANRQTLKDHRDTLEECVKTIDGMLAQTEQKADLEKAHKLKVEYLHLQVPTV